MKITPDDPRISAYLLGELGPAEAAEIERAAAADPAIRLSLDEMRRTTAFLDGLFGAGEAALHPAQREAILRAGRDADATGKVVATETLSKTASTATPANAFCSCNGMPSFS